MKSTSHYYYVEQVLPDKREVVRAVEVLIRPKYSREKLLSYKVKEPTKMKFAIQRLILILPQENTNIPDEVATPEKEEVLDTI